MKLKQYTIIDKVALKALKQDTIALLTSNLLPPSETLHLKPTPARPYSLKLEQ